MPSPVDIFTAHGALDNNYVLVLTTNSVERDAVIATLDDMVVARLPMPNHGARLGHIAGRQALLINGTSGAQEDSSVGRIARRLLASNAPRPILVLLVGFGWGNPALTSTGDVLVTREVRAANHQRLGDGRSVRRVRTLVSPIGPFDDLIAALAGDVQFRVHSGPIVSAETHFSDTEARNALLDATPEAAGGDMEAYDLMPDLDGLPWLVIKGIADHGDEATDRKGQKEAAARAAGLIPRLLYALAAEEQIPPPREDRLSRALHLAMTGDAIRIGARDCDPQALNTFLNNRIGPRLLERLSAYGSADDKPGRRIYLLTDLLLELAQNAIRHGGATHVTIGFGEASITIFDDGRPFDPASLDGAAASGGSRAWHRFRHDFIETELVSFTREPRSRGNRCRFVLRDVTEALRHARTNCAIRLDWSAGSEPGIPALRFDPDCQGLFFDASQILMMSRRLGFWAQLEGLLKEGRVVYLACRDAEEVLLYEQELGRIATDNLHIFVGSA